MKKVVSLLLVTALILALAGCGSSGNGSANDARSSKTTAEENQTAAGGESKEVEGNDNVQEAASNESGRPTEGNGKIGFSTMTLGSEFFIDVDNKVHDRLEAAGYEVVTVSCEGNVATQVADIENLISMDCEAIFFFAADPEALTDVCKKGKAAGIKMYGVAAPMTDPDSYDAVIGTNQYDAGASAAQLMSDWVDATFPDAEDRSIEIVVLGSTASAENAARTDGMCSVEEMNSKVKVVEVYDIAGGTNGNLISQEYASMMQGKYPDLKGIISFATDCSLGANEVYMKDVNLDRSQFAITGVEGNQAVYDAIAASRTNDALIRAHASFGDDLSIDVWDCLTGKSWQYKDEKNYIYNPCKLITVDNIDEYVK